MGRQLDDMRSYRGKAKASTGEVPSHGEQVAVFRLLKYGLYLLFQVGPVT